MKVSYIIFSDKKKDWGDAVFGFLCVLFCGFCCLCCILVLLFVSGCLCFWVFVFCFVGGVVYWGGCLFVWGVRGFGCGFFGFCALCFLL